jgi:hypothetical protein
VAVTGQWASTVPVGADGRPAGDVLLWADTRARARQAVTDAIIGTIGVGQEVLTGVRTIITSGLVGITVFAQTLVNGGDVIAAIQAGADDYAVAFATVVKASETRGLSADAGVQKTFREAADEAGMSRRYGGIHFEDGDLVARKMGAQIGEQVWRKAEQLFGDNSDDR